MAEMQRYFKSVLNYVSKNEFRKGFLFIFSSKLLIAFATFISTPFVARLFKPDDYGLFALLNSAGLALSVLSHLTLPTSLIFVEERKVKEVTTTIATWLAFVNCIFLIAGIFIATLPSLNSLLEQHLHLKITIHISCIVVLFSCLESFSQIFANLNIRNRDFKQNVGVNMVENFSTKLISLLIGFFRYTPFGLFYSELGGKFMNIVSQLKGRQFKFEFIDKDNFGKGSFAVETLKEYYHYPMYNLPVSLMNQFSSQVILWFFAFSFSNQLVGFFTMGMSLLNIPLQLIANSMQPVIIKKLDDDQKRSTGTFWSLILKIGALSSTIYLIIYLVSPWFISMYLGKIWMQSVDFVQILCVPYTMQMVNNSIDGAFIVYKRQRAQFYFKIVSLLLILLAIYLISFVSISIRSAIIVYSVVLSIGELSKIIFLLIITKHVRSSKVL